MRRFNPEKELYKIQHGNRNKIIIGVIALLLVIAIGSTYALYQVRYSKRIIYTKVAPISNNQDLELAVYVDDKQLTDFPENAGYQYIFDYIKCEKDGITTAKWDYEQGGLSVLTKGPNKCSVYFIEKLEIEFPYISDITEYVIPYTGNYKLEVWGAQGGNSGGQGGYSYGNMRFDKGTTIYIVVGGTAGYNGGGGVGSASSGGGATHIATTTGLLSTLSQKQDAVLIVAGGGGGGAGNGVGGGLTGGNGVNGSWSADCDVNGKMWGPCAWTSYSTGGSQTGGGTGGQHYVYQYNPAYNGGPAGYTGTFGAGVYWGCGSGSGWYGGGTGGGSGTGTCGGGSGYLNTALTEANTQQGGNTGDGKAKISYLGNN